MCRFSECKLVINHALKRSKTALKPRHFKRDTLHVQRALRLFSGILNALQGLAFCPVRGQQKHPAAPLQTVRAGPAGIAAGHKETPEGLAANRGIFRWFFVPFSATFQADFRENFSGFLPDSRSIVAGKSRGIFCEKVAESLWKVAPESRRQESLGSEPQSRDQESLAVDSTKVASPSTRYFLAMSSAL